MMRRKLAVFLALTTAAMLVLGGCGAKSGKGGSQDMTGSTGGNPATEHTKAANQAWYDKLDFTDKSEWDNANRGLIDAPEELELVAWTRP
ncbi:MAG: hypothetical protein K5853_05335 [Lachnospiraceae bacterium]|nr:hypothetical protein [Lachnospiraceae bacterium]